MGHATLQDVRSLSTPLAVGAAAVAAAGVGSLAYARWEADRYLLRQVDIPVLASGPALRVLHISDLHLAQHQPKRERWVAALADLTPDLVVATGDFISQSVAIERLSAALGGLLSRPGVFVFGSNDEHDAKPINPLKYFRGPSRVSRHRRSADTHRLAAVLTSAGWINLNNASTTMQIAGHMVSCTGTGDAHIHRDDYPSVAHSWNPEADLRLGVTHAPYARVLDAMADDGADLIFAGHTHGGQVCLPRFGALVTNCDLDRSRVKGLSRHGNSWLHVSAGIGTNPYAQIRVACRPEATLLTLTPRPDNAAEPGRDNATA